VTQSYRTEIYHDTGEMGPHLVYWSLAEGDSEKTALVLRHEAYATHRFFTPMHDGELDVAAAVKMVARLEAEAAQSLKPVDMQLYKNFMAAGEEFHRALPIARHPVQIEAMRLDALKTKSAGARFKLKS